jgi:V8-like Glu-specific endopeptidase
MNLSSLRRVLVAALAIILFGTTAVSAITFPDSKKVLPTDAPWVVSFWGIDSQFDRQPDGFFCTGSLIDPYTVVTAAHCIEAAANFESYVVVRNQTASSDHGQVLMPRTSRYYDFDSNTLAGDLALIDLYNPASASAFLKIPTKAQAKKMLVQKPVLYGWGQTEKQRSAKFLRKVVQGIFNSEAESEYRDFDAKYQIGVNRKNSNGTYSSACFGDSGGPFVGRLHSSYFLLGVVSFGNADECATKAPVVLTRITAYRDLIRTIRNELADNRQSQEVDVSNLHYRNTLTNPIVPDFGTLSDDSKYRMWTANFVTELMDNPVSDLKTMRVTSYEPMNGFWDVVIDLESKEVFGADGCGFGEAWNRDSGLGAQLSMQIRAATKWTTAVQFSYVADVDECLTSEGVQMTVSELGGFEVGDQCSAWLYLDEDGILTVGTVRDCLPNPSALNIRAALSTYAITDIEPGFDMWSGPFDVTDPATN